MYSFRFRQYTMGWHCNKLLYGVHGIKLSDDYTLEMPINIFRDH